MTARTNAARYARALLDVALAESDPRVVAQQLADVVELFQGHAGLWAAMTNPAVPVTKKQAIIAALLPKLDLVAPLGKILGLLAERDRIGLLPDLRDRYGARLMDHEKVVRASVTSAVALPADRAEKLKASLGALTGRRVEMTLATDPGIMGGVVAQIGSTVYDGSVKRQLERVRERLNSSL